MSASDWLESDDGVKNRFFIIIIISIRSFFTYPFLNKYMKKYIISFNGTYPSFEIDGLNKKKGKTKGIKFNKLCKIFI